MTSAARTVTGRGRPSSRDAADDAAPSVLRELADYMQIVPEYLDQTGREVRVTSDETRRALLAALGSDASTDDAARESLATLRAADGQRIIPPVRVVEVGSAGASRMSVQSPPARGTSGPWRVELETEDGARRVLEGPWRGGAALDLALPPNIPIGYHKLRVTLSAGGHEWTDEQTLIVVPPRCTTPADVLGERKVFGLIANLYTVQSATNWGIGDFSDLASLAQWGGDAGADFVGVNPLHALLNRGIDVSPYSPVSRLFRNPIYIDITRVPELAHAPEVRERLTSPEMTAEISALREYPDVRYEQVMAVKGLALTALHRVFAERVSDTGDARDVEYKRYVEENEPALTKFATWMAIEEVQAGAQRGNGRAHDWRAWPIELQSPDSDAVKTFAAEHAQRVDFHRWLQFEADRQIAIVASSARGAGMAIGLYQDLAIGTSAAGADAWAYPSLFVRGVSIGAPPDPYAAAGQNWGLPPINPRALRQDRYRYFIDLLRSGFRHAGALRIDHVLGFFRLFWIPDGMSGADGAYVRSPTSDLLGIVALESVRHNALVVGEDLGTVPKEVPPTLDKWGILSSKVLYFERNRRGGFKGAKTYPELALATANTHDMAPLAGFWQGRDIDVRAQVGLVEEDSINQARDDRDEQRTALLRRLRQEKVLPSAHAPRSAAELRAAIHAFLCRTPSRLVGLALDDLAGEVDQVNVPGVSPDKFPSWTRKMRERLETLMLSTEVRTALRCDGRLKAVPPG
jgi:4-alpha-glucanotransferase